MVTRTGISTECQSWVTAGLGEFITPSKQLSKLTFPLSYVDKVWSRLSLKQFARKRFLKGKDDAHNRARHERIVTELEVLKKISRDKNANHLVNLCGSYTDEKCIGILMEPVADCDLMQFLEALNPLSPSYQDDLVFLRTCYGCLAKAVEYLHYNRVRHRDLKPQNILIHQRQVYLADFGDALDWSKQGHSTTQDQAIRYTEFYRAPECSQGQQRNTAADMWSIGVIYLEITTVLRQRKVEDFAKALNRLPDMQKGINVVLTSLNMKESYPHSNLEGVTKWLVTLQKDGRGTPIDLEPISWIKSLLQKQPKSRPTAAGLLRQILESVSSQDFCGFCCSNDIDIYDGFDAGGTSDSGSGVDWPSEESQTALREAINGMLQVGSTNGAKNPTRNLKIDQWMESISEAPGSYPELEEVYDSQNAEQQHQVDHVRREEHFVEPEAEVVSDPLYVVVEDRSDSGSSDEGIQNDTAFSVTSDSSASDETVRPISDQNVLSSSDAHNTLIVGEQVLMEGETPSLGLVKTEHDQLDQHYLSEEDSGANESMSSVITPKLLGPTNQLQSLHQSKGCKDIDELEEVGNDSYIATVNTPELEDSELIPHEQIDLSKKDPKQEKKEKEPEKDDSVNNVSKLTSNETLQLTSSSNQPPETKSRKGDKKSHENPPRKPNQKEVPDPEDSTSQKLKRLPLRSKHLRPKRISASAFLDQQWEEASVATSAMSEATAKLLRGGAILAWRDKHENLLELFAKRGRASAVRALLELGCNPGTLKKPRPAPLINAIKGRSLQHNKCVRELLEHGANVNAKVSSRTALHQAIENDEFNGYKKLLRMLIDAGADTNALDRVKDRPIMKILQSSQDKRLGEHERVTLALLLKSDTTKIDISTAGSLDTPLHLAIRRKDEYATGMLLEKCADVNKKNASDVDPLLLAASQWRGSMIDSQMSILDLLLDEKYGVAINATGGPKKRTALHQAVEKGVEVAVEMLLEHQADPFVKDSNGSNALQIAIENTQRMSTQAHENIMESLFIAMDSPLTDKIKGGKCLLATVMAHGNNNRLRTLLSHGIKVNTKLPQPCPTLAFRAMKHENEAALRELLKRKADVKTQNEDGEDALKYALNHLSNFHQKAMKICNAFNASNIE